MLYYRLAFSVPCCDDCVCLDDDSDDDDDGVRHRQSMQIKQSN